MQEFKAYLLSMHIAGPKAVDFYIHWVTRFYRFARKKPGDDVTQEEKEAYLRHLSKNRESWQVDQAEKAMGGAQHSLSQPTRRAGALLAGEAGVRRSDRR